MGRSKWWIYISLIVIFVAYVAWMLGPYLYSTIVRDASVTTWSRAVVAPIDGKIVTELPEVGSLIGEDGYVVTIRNDLLLQEKLAIEKIRDRAILARSRIEEAKEYLADIRELTRTRIAYRDRQAKVFHVQLETEITSLRREIQVNIEKIEVAQRIVERTQSLLEGGAGSAASLDEALLRLTEMKSREAQLETDLDFAVLRDRAAEDGVFITASGEIPTWVQYSELELQLEEKRTRHDMHAAETALEEAQRDLASEQQTMDSLASVTVTAPPGSIVFSVVASPQTTLAAGDPVIDWIDCSNLMVDVPVSDAELPLISAGTRAEVVLEGESQVRDATVLLTRGSSATLDRTDLAAIAKGRTHGVAQVLLTLDPDSSSFAECPVGWAAYVDFPDIGLLDVLGARLRL